MDPVTAALAGWLVDQAATSGQRLLARWLAGDKQAKALRVVVSDAIEAAVAEMDGTGDRELVEEALRREDSGSAEIDVTDVLALGDAVRRLISPRLAVLAEQGYQVDAGRLADAITRKIVEGIQLDAVRGGPLGPLADHLRHERLAGAADQIVGLLSSALPHPASAAALNRVVRVAPQPAPLAGREQLLAEVRERLSGDAGRWPRVVVLHGLGGAGKTSAALEHAHAHLDEYGVVWQLAAEDQATLAGGFAELGRQLVGQDLAAAGDPVTRVHGILAGRPGGWLLIFDNAVGQAALRGLLPPAGRGHVIITSQSPRWPSGQAIEVPVLDVAVAAEFLAERSGSPATGVARDLAGELGGLPLALEQAAAYMEVTGRSLAGYLAQFRDRRAALLARGEPLGYSKTVASTWSVAFGRVEESAPLAVGLLRLLACCAPVAVPLPLLLRPRPGLSGQLAAGVAAALVPLLEDPLAVHDAIGALRQYSLVTPAGDDSVWVHRLVQAVTFDQMPATMAAQWRQAAAALIGAAIPADASTPEAWPASAALLPHALTALDPDSDAMGRIADHLGRSGSYAAARDLWRMIADARDQVRGGHPGSVAARRASAHWTGEAGDPDGARDQFAALLPELARALGAEHPDTLATWHSLGEWTGKAGEAATARDLFAELLPIRARVIGRQHPDTLVTSGNLAYWTGDAGDPVAARDLFAALLPASERALGAEHPDSLAIRHSIAYWTREAGGDPAAARDQFAALLPVRQRVIGREHPDTLETQHALADSTGQAGDPVAARDLFAALLPVRERVLGAGHFDTQAARDRLAHWTGQTGHDDEPASHEVRDAPSTAG